MLGKLMKYDLKSVFKVLIIFYILGIIFAVLTRIFLNIDNSLMFYIIGKICSGVTIGMIFNIIINNIFRMWARFRRNLYSDEAYLTHTLPVEKSQLYLSKFLTSIITMINSILVIAFIIFIAYYSKYNITLLKTSLFRISTAYNIKIYRFIITTFIVFFLEIATIIQAGFNGIILGYRATSNKIIHSVIIGFISYTISQIICLLFIYVVAFFDNNLMNLFISNNVGFETVQLVIYLAILVYSLIIGGYYIINNKIFCKGVNIE